MKSNKKYIYGLQEIKVHMGMFDYGVNCVAGDWNKLESYLRYLYRKPDYDLYGFYPNGAPRGLCNRLSGFVPVIWIPRKPKTIREQGTLAHEAVHAMFDLFGWAGMPMTRDTEEVMAHGVSHLVKKILEEL